MAGYLGKISAIVSANTADFAGKLAGSAQEVRKFASAVESTIGSASRRAAASLADMYTPLQKLERALQAAASMKLSFSGFAGAIKDIDVLKQRMTSLNQRQIDVILRTSGLKSIEEFKNAVQGLNAKQFDVLVRVGGVDKLKALRDDIAAGRGEFEVVAKTKEAEERVRELTRRVNEARKAGTVVIAVDDAAVAAARSELRRFTIEQSKALGQQRVKPREFRADLTSSIAAEEAALEAARRRQEERDRLLAAARSGKQRQNINQNYSGVDEEVTSRTAAIEKLKASLAELTALESKLKALRATRVSDSGLRQYEAELEAAKKKHKELAAQAQRKITAAIGINISQAELERVLSGAIERGEILERVFKEAGFAGTAAFERVAAVLKSLGISDMTAALAKARQMASVTEEITKPLGAASKAAAALGANIQSKVLPTLSASQAATERLVAMIEKGEAPAIVIAREFAKVRASASAAAQDVARLTEANNLLGQMRTGRELAFVKPNLYGALNRSVSIGNKAAELPPSAIAQNPSIVANLTSINKLSNDAVAVFAKLQAKAAAGLSLTATERELQKVINKLTLAQNAAERGITIHLDTAAVNAEIDQLKAYAKFSITGKVENAAQVQAEINRIIGQLSRLNDVGRAAVAPKLNAAITSLGARDTAGKPDIAAMQAAVAALVREFDKQHTLKLNVADAKAAVDKLREALAAVVSRLSPSMSPMDALVKSADAAKAAVDRVTDATKKAQLQSRVAGVTAMMAPLLDKNNPALANMSPADLAKEQARLAARLQKIIADANQASRPTATDVFGPALGSSKERMATLQSLIQSLQSSIAALPKPIRDQMIPALDKVRSQFAALGDNPTARQLRDASREADNLEKRLRRVQESKATLDKLRESFAGVAAKISPITSPMDSLNASADAAKAAVDRVTDAIKKAQLQSRLDAVTARIAPLYDKNNPALANMSPAQIAREQARQAARLQQITADAGKASAPTATDIFGAALNSSKERLASLQSAILATQSSIAALPQPLRDGMIPALNRVRTLFASLGDNPTAKQLRDATREADNLERRLRRVQDAAKFTGTMRSFINDTAIDRYQAQLAAIKNGLLAVGAAAGGPVASAVNQYEKALREAAKSGRLGTESTKQQMMAMLKDIERVAVATGLMTKKQAEAFMRSVVSAGKGDVSRMGVDKFSLALNQAAFAVDDLMSSTGGLEFRLRAVSNNITQLGFILGGTAGLFVSLGAVILGQASVALIKWLNNGKTAADQTKALNDSLSRQKSIVSELAQAYRALGEATARGAISEGATQSVSLIQQRRAISRNVLDSTAEARLAANSSPLAPMAIADVFRGIFKTIDRRREFKGVVEERAERNALERQREASSSVSERSVLEQQIRESRNRERAAANRLFAQGNAASAESVANSLRQSVAESRRASQAPSLSTTVSGVLRNAQNFFGGPSSSAIVEPLLAAIDAVQANRRNARDAANARAERLAAGVAGGDDIPALSARLDAVRQAILDRRSELRERDLGMRTPNAAAADRALVDLTEKEKAIQGAIEQKLTLAADGVYASMEEAAAGIRNAHTDVTDAIERGVLAAAPLRSLLNSLASELSAAQAELQMAERAAEKAPEGAAEGAVEARPADREAAIQAAKARVDAVIAKQAEVEQAARSARLGRQFGGARTQSVLSAMEGSERFASQGAGGIAALRRVIGDEIIARKKAQDALARETAIADDLGKKQAELAQLQSAGTNLRRQAELEAEVKSSEAALRLAKDNTAAATASAQLAARLSEATAVAEEFRVSMEQSLARTRKLGDSALQGSERFADEMQQRFVEGRGATQADRDDAETRLIADTELVRKAQIDLDRARDNAKSLPAVAALEAERARLDSSIKTFEELRRLNPGRAYDLTDERKRMVEIDKQISDILFNETANERSSLSRVGQVQAERARAFRGRDLSLNERDRALKEFREGVGGDIAARAAELRDQNVNPKDYVNEAFREQRRQIAPAIQALEDERQNALLMGPSRQALQFSDITNQQGQTELTRLLRGQDSSQDRNLTELNKQSGLLEEIRRVLERNTNVTIDM